MILSFPKTAEQLSFPQLKEGVSAPISSPLSMWHAMNSWFSSLLGQLL